MMSIENWKDLEREQLCIVKHWHHLNKSKASSCCNTTINFIRINIGRHYKGLEFNIAN